MAYPTDLDSYTAINGTTLVSTGHAGTHNQVGSAMMAIEEKLGVGSGTPTANKALIGSGNGTSGWASTWNNATFGTPTITGGTVNLATLGTPAVTGGTLTNPLISGGTGNGMVLGTPTIGSITVPGTTAALSFSAAIAPAAGSLVDVAGGTHTVNAQQYQLYYSVMGTTAGNRTIGTPLNPTPWQSLTFAFKVGGASGTLVWSSAFRFSQTTGTATLGTYNQSWNYYSFRYYPLAGLWDFQGQSINVYA